MPNKTAEGGFVWHSLPNGRKVPIFKRFRDACSCIVLHILVRLESRYGSTWIWSRLAVVHTQGLARRAGRWPGRVARQGAARRQRGADLLPRLAHFDGFSHKG